MTGVTLHGILAVDKGPGWTSHDVVARVRRLAGQKQVGHAGTLDPLATGLLLLVLGRATRLSSYLMAGEKEYLAEVVLGVTTRTDDAEAPMLERRPVPSFSREEIEAAVSRFVGIIAQVPPAYAAVRQGGQRLYVLARKGVEIEAPSRTVTISAIDILSWDNPRLRLRVRCGSGTYIRALARDIGAALGTGGYLHALRRTVSGSFTVREAATLDQLAQVAAEGPGGLVPILAAPDRAVLDLPAAVLSAEDAGRVRHGNAVRLGRIVEGTVRLYAPGGEFLALARMQGATARPFLVVGEGA